MIPTGTAAVLKTGIADLNLVNEGKVREIYDLGDSLLLVATDRISAFDVVFGQGIPHKGHILTAISLFWFDWLKDLTKHHLITGDIDQMPEAVQAHRDLLVGRSMQVKKAEVFPIECVVRGYLTGSGLKDYNRTGSVCGIPLPEGLVDSQILEEPIFTPATKATAGHDENISFERTVDIVGKKTADTLRDLSFSIYTRARDYACEQGLILCDTKFEFGVSDGEIILIDEVLTPDSSRYWPADLYAPGKPQPSFDKQIVRNYLETTGWDKAPPAPDLPEEITSKTTAKYLEAFERLTSKKLLV